eukprot:c28419_g1_i2 orf=538-2040(-)
MDGLAASKSGMIIAGRTARPCDACGKDRARWYCAADEAYLCERCDGSVHSANPVASRHERVKLGSNGAPVKINRRSSLTTNESPSRRKDESLGVFAASKAWHHGSRKRSRITYPRPIGQLAFQSPLLPRAATAKEVEARILMPLPEEDTQTPKSELACTYLTPSPSSDCFGTYTVKLERTSPVEEDQLTDNLTEGLRFPKTEDSDLAHEVPIFEPLLQELISGSGDLMERILPTTPSWSNDATTGFMDREAKAEKIDDHFLDSRSSQYEIESDINSMIEEGSISIDDVSGLDAFDVTDLCTSSNMDNESDEFDLPIMEMWRNHLDSFNGGCDEAGLLGPSPFKAKGERHLEPESVTLEQGVDLIHAMDVTSFDELEKKSKPKTFSRTLSLRLNYEDVLSAWSDRGSLWMDGCRPQTVPDDSILDGCSIGIVPEIMGSQPGDQVGQVPVIDQSNAGAEREARVMRYREKRRTRFFSKKIRYEVRKLNAERRPRMKISKLQL